MVSSLAMFLLVSRIFIGLSIGEMAWFIFCRKMRFFSFSIRSSISLTDNSLISVVFMNLQICFNIIPSDDELGCNGQLLRGQSQCFLGHFKRHTFGFNQNTTGG